VALTFRYKKGRLPNGSDVFRPAIPIELRYEKEPLSIVALVDSGSDVSFLPAWAAEALDIKSSGKEYKVDTVSGKLAAVDECLHVTNTP
jgi:hypothetical protein